MPAQIQPMPYVLGPAYIRSARVTQEVSDRVYRVLMEGQAEITARSTLPSSCAPKPGDLVLVAGESPSSGYIIGMLDAVAAEAVRTADGAGAKVLGQGDDQHIAVHDADNRILFEYYPADRRCLIRAPQGDLRLAAPNGCIDLQAGQGIRCDSEGEVALRSRRCVRLAAEGENGGLDQNLEIDGHGARLGVDKMALTAGQADISIARSVYRGQQLTSTVDRARMIYGKLETTAERIWQNSGYLFRQVRHLCQMQAGRLRTLVKGAHYTQSQRATLIAKEDVRIDGQKINLG